MARSHTMTPARRAALKKAQMASARKRRGKGKGKLAAANRKADSRSSRKRRIIGAVAYGAYVGAMGYFQYKQYKKARSNIRRIRARSEVEVRGILLGRMSPAEKRRFTKLDIQQRRARVNRVGAVNK